MRYRALNPAALLTDVRPQLRLVVPSHDLHDPALVRRSGRAREVLALANAHGLTGMLSDTWPPEVVEAAQHARQQNIAAYLRALHALQTMGGLLSAAEIPWVVVKGPAVAVEYYGRPDLRPFSDIDILVPPGAFRNVVSLLEEAGGRLAVGNWTPLLERGASEIPIVMPNGVVIDLHWHLVNRQRLRRQVSMNTDAFLARSTVLVAGVRTLSSVDCAVHLAWHAGYSGCTRLIWACDIELVAARLSAEQASEFVGRCRSGNIALMVAVALDWTALAFPDGAAAKLAQRLPGSMWRRVAAAVTARMVTRPSGRRTGQFVTRSTRTTTIRSLAAAVERLPSMLGTRSRPPVPDPAFSVAAREKYFRAVAAGTI